MKPRIVPRTPASSGVDHPSSSRCSESAPVISVVMALSPSAAANRRFGFQIKPEITPPPIPTNPGTAPPSDIEGVYGAAGAGLAVGKGARAIVLTNQKGAVLELSGNQVGLLANADLSGLAITLE